MKWTGQNSSNVIKENDSCRRILRVPIDWLYENTSRQRKNREILVHILTKNKEDVPFIINERRYRVINNEVVETIFFRVLN